jgi:iron(III) transport system ATP-binding protein
VSREVATFLGNANFLPGQVDGAGRAACELGQFAADGHAAGPVTVMLRPEDIGLTPDDNGATMVTSREYFGHDQLVRLQLPSGAELHSRLLGSEGNFTAGQRVALSVRGEAVIFPT